MDAIVLAGSIPEPADPLYALTKGRPKAMIPIGDRPMIAHVVAALHDAKEIEKVLVVGLDDPADQQMLAACDIAKFLPDQGSMVANGMAGLEWLAENRPDTTVVMGCSSDIPHLAGFMIDELIDLCRPFDRLLYYPVIKRSLMEARYPTAARTFATLKGGLELAGGDVFILQKAFLHTDHSLWEKLTGARKNPLEIARIIGWGTLLKLVFNQLSLEEAASLGGRILGSDRPIGIVFPPFAELGMDADKPHQVEILRQKWK